MRNFLIDTDTASDDAVAIMMALAEPSVRVLGLTAVAGNVDLKQATRNALLTAEICGSDLPVFGDRDKTMHDKVEELSLERQRGYNWYNSGPQEMLDTYATWSAAHPLPPS